MRRAPVWALAGAACLCLPSAAQTRLSLSEAGARKPPDYTAAHLDQAVTVRGVVAAPAFHFPVYTVLALADGPGGGALELPRSDSRLDSLHPGDEIEATGTVIMVAGMVLIRPSSVTTLGHKSPPAALDLPLPQLQSLAYLGRLVRTEGRIQEIGETSSGEFLVIAEADARYRIFVPLGGRTPAGLASLVSEGDRVRVTGVAYQYAPRRPYNRDFELLAAGPADIVRLERARFIPTVALGVALALVALTAILLWTRERRMNTQRATLRKTYQLGEDILSSPTPEAASERIAEALPAILGVTRVRLYIHNRGAGTLDEVAVKNGKVVSIPLAPAPDNTQSGAAACFHYRTLLVVPDTARSPFPMVAGGPAGGSMDGAMPKAQLFVPMVTQGDLVGVMELDQDNRARVFHADEQALAQHLANQMAVALKLLGQRSVQEQLFRTEKLAAVGRLISGVVNELQTPLASIADLATRAARTVHGGAAGKDLAAIAAEAEKASAMVARLVSFAAAGPAEARPVSIGTLLRNLVDFRERDWKASGIKVRDLVTGEPLMVMGSHGQLEQVFLRLLVHAEQSLAAAPEKVLTIRTSLLARMVVVEIVFSARGEAHNPEEVAAILGVTRSVIAGHGGEVRLIEKSHADVRFEVELPLLAKERAVLVDSSANERAAPSGRRMTALVIETEETALRQILGLLAARGYRVVPVNNTDTGLDLAQRLRFDVVFCSVRAPGLNWVELAERIQSKVTGFVLMSDGYDAELAADFEADGRFVLAKPVQDSELRKVLGSIERPIPA
ncbi:MAG: GAF domain-containing protein [Bryobacteraceae bacterium]